MAGRSAAADSRCEELGTAREQLERFVTTHRDLVSLFRQNRDVRSLHSARRRPALRNAPRAVDCREHPQKSSQRGTRLAMGTQMEIISLALAAAFFALSWALIALCERLLG